MQSALERVGVVREVVERGAQAQRSRYDTVKLERRRKDEMAALGEAVYRRAVRGNLGELGEDPDVHAKLEEIDSLDQRIEASEGRGASGFGANAGWPKQRGPATGGDGKPMRVWRPVPPFAAPDGADPDDDLEPLPPPIDIGAAPEAVAQVRSGGIRFGDDWDDDDDLEEYMHADDVPQAADTALAPEAAAVSEPAAAPARSPKPRRRRAPKKKQSE